MKRFDAIIIGTGQAGPPWRRDFLTRAKRSQLSNVTATTADISNT
jgi:hypothetical protein